MTRKAANHGGLGRFIKPKKTPRARKQAGAFDRKGGMRYIASATKQRPQYNLPLRLVSSETVSSETIGRRPRRDSLCVWNVRPLTHAFLLADDSATPRLTSRGFRVASSGPGQTGKPQVDLAPDPRNGCPIRSVMRPAAMPPRCSRWSMRRLVLCLEEAEREKCE